LGLVKIKGNSQILFSARLCWET